MKRKDKKGEEAYSYGAVTLTIAERGAGTPPVQSAFAKTKVGDDFVATVDPSIQVRDGDIVHGRIDLEQPPGVILISSTGNVVTLDDYGINNTGPNAGQNGFILYSLKGECMQRKDRIVLFNSVQRHVFPTMDGCLCWLYCSWIDDQRGHVVVVLSAPRPELRPIVTVKIDSGEARQGGSELIDQAISARNPGGLSQSLELGKAMKLRGSMASLPGIVADKNMPLGQRLRAAVFLAALGDRSGGNLITETALKAAEQEAGSATYEQKEDVHYAIKHSTEVLGEAALPLLTRTLRANGAAYSRAHYAAFGLLGRKSLPTLISVLEDDRNLDSQLEAATCLGYIGPEAEDAVPALISALHKKGTKKFGEITCRLDTHAAWALEQMGNKATAAVPDLEQLVKDSDEELRNAARRALASIQGKPRQR